MKTIQFEVSDNLYQKLLEVFYFLDDLEPHEKVNKFSNFAFEVTCDWILGEKRFRSLTEQQIAWIEKLYIDIIPPTEKPSYDRLYNEFHLSAGQAQYIARVLTDKKLTQWRKVALTELNIELESKKEDAELLIQNNEGNEPITITIDKLAATELKRITDALWKNNKELLLPSHRPGYGEIKNIDIPAQTLIIILNHLNQ